MYDYWLSKVKDLKGELSGYWHYAFSFCSKEGKVVNITHDWPFLFTQNPSTSYPKGWPLSAFCLDPKTKESFVGFSKERKEELDKGLFNDLEKMFRGVI